MRPVIYDTMHHILRSVLAALVFAAGATASVVPAVSATPSEHLRGSIVSSTTDSLTIKTASGDVTVALSPKTAIAGALPGTPSDIKPGTFLGIASVAGSGANRALEVVVFPDSMRGAGEGDYPWDLGNSKSHSSMTNGTVAMPHSTMTNATVGSMSGAAQKTITMNYKGGSRKLIVPANAPIVRVAPGDKTLFVAGAAVFAIAAKTDAGYNASFIVVGKDATKLPM